MKKYAMAAIAALPACLGAGCNSARPGTEIVLGAYSYDKAFTTGRDVMRQYFSVAESDRKSGLIRTHPDRFEMRRTRWVSSCPSRRTAELWLRREDDFVVANLAVTIQQDASRAYRHQRMAEENSGRIANRTPAKLEGATTDEQNRTWQTVRYDHKLERTILQQIRQALESGGDLLPERAESQSRAASRTRDISDGG
ncbi:MAG: hypothetical protein J7M14_05590 [Planctomycetes bacterium]|nr:hypothetical protein [Planctomycetota bacterium]